MTRQQNRRFRMSEVVAEATFLVRDEPPRSTRVYDWDGFRRKAVEESGKWVGMEHKSAHVTASQIRAGKRYSAYDWSDYEIASDMTTLWIRYAPIPS
jgi:hypothetical protein